MEMVSAVENLLWQGLVSDSEVMANLLSVENLFISVAVSNDVWLYLINVVKEDFVIIITSFIALIVSVSTVKSINWSTSF